MLFPVFKRKSPCFRYLRDFTCAPSLYQPKKTILYTWCLHTYQYNVENSLCDIYISMFLYIAYVYIVIEVGWNLVAHDLSYRSVNCSKQCVLRRRYALKKKKKRQPTTVLCTPGYHTVGILYRYHFFFLLIGDSLGPFEMIRWEQTRSSFHAMQLMQLLERDGEVHSICHSLRRSR